jgi:hypothetical protein
MVQEQDTGMESRTGLLVAGLQGTTTSSKSKARIQVPRRRMARVLLSPVS